MTVDAARPARVLLVDDDKTDVELTRATLAAARLAVQFHIVGSGEEALTYLRREGKHAQAPVPDLVMLDIKMPGISGIETLRLVKEDPRFDRLPVIMLTSSSHDEEILRGYTGQAYAFMTKPIDVDSFRGILRRIEDFWLMLAVIPRG